MSSITSLFRLFVLTTLALVGSALITGVPTPAAAGQAKYVIEISVDGGGSSYIQSQIDLGKLPNFKRFQTQGAWTNNARNDYDITVTLPNHVTMVTGRGIKGIESNGHMWTSNSDPSSVATATDYSIQNNKGSYVYGVFDVAHDNGLHTALYATKTKFSLFEHSYNNGNGAPDNTGTDNGRSKIDVYAYNSSSSTITGNLIDAMKADPFNYVLVHFTDCDTAGHATGWGSTAYNNALTAVDGYLGKIFDLATGTPALQGKTDIILTADHGGKGTDHSINTEFLNYTVPLYVWGPDAEAGTDLYALNTATRTNPGPTTRPAYTDEVQPIRNGELANLALHILGLAAVPGSTINPAQNLAITSQSAFGECGSDSGKALTTAPVNLCTAGVASAVSGSGPWTWSCTNGGVSAACNATVLTYPVITTSSLPSGTLGVLYSKSLEATGGTSPYTWSLPSGYLPSGLSLSSIGTISGTPSAAGSTRFTVRVSDAVDSTAEKTFDLTIAAGPLQITTGSPLPSASKKVSYSTTLSAAGGVSPYTWSVSSGKLPPGLSLNSSTGAIIGKASKSGTSTFTVKVTDTMNISSIKVFMLTVK